MYPFDINRELGDWFNYEFPHLSSFDFQQSTEIHIGDLRHEENLNKYVAAIFDSFSKYFNENSQRYLSFINSNRLNLINFGENKVASLGSQLNLKDLSDFVSSKFRSDEFDNVKKNGYGQIIKPNTLVL